MFVFLLAKELEISSRLESDGVDQLVESDDDALVKPIQLSDSLGRQESITVKRGQQSCRQRSVDLFKQLQVN
jgi:hypothetical protein